MSGSSLPKWFVLLRRALARFHIRVAGAVSRQDCLIVQLEHREQELTVNICHAALNRPYYLRTGRFHITYRGSDPPGPAGEKVLARLAGILTRMEHGLPRMLRLQEAFGAPADRDPDLPFFCTVETSLPDTGEPMAEAMIRLTARCNQNCPFCSGERVHREPGLDEIAGCLADLSGRFGHLMATVTGGEPTLSPVFGDCVAMLAGMDTVNRLQIQTNGVAFSDQARLAGLPPTAKLHFFISLHATQETVYDRCTGTRGQFGRAMQGITNIAAAGHQIILNCVVSTLNIDHIPDYTRALPQMPPHALPLTLHFSALICPERNPAARDYLVRYPSLTRRLEKAVVRAGQAGIRVSPLQSSTHAAIPPCFVAQALRNYGGKAFDMAGVRIGREGDDTQAWAKSEACGRCRYDRRCMGVPGAYARRFGLDELNPVRDILAQKAP